MLIDNKDALTAVDDCNYKIMSGYEWIRKQEIKKRLKELPSAEHHNLNVADYIKDSFPDVWKQAEKELELPSAERVGKWIEDKYGNILCSECNWSAPKVRVGLADRHLDYAKSAYCWHCGARMVSEK